MDLSFIIINYNTTALTIKCIQSIYQFTKSNTFEVILIDNASADQSIKTIEEQFHDIQLVRNTENIGFGRANNQGIQMANGKYIFLLNSDTALTSDAAATFFQYLEEESHHNVACCGGVLVKPNGDNQVSYGNFPTVTEAIASLGFLRLFKEHFNRYLSSGVFNFSDVIRPVDYICGADLFLRKSVLHNIGSFDPDFFLYFEETELCYRIRKAGLMTMLLPQVTIIHHEGASQDFDKFNEFRLLHYARSRRLYFKKTGNKISAMVINKIYGLQALIFLITKKQRRYLKTARILFNS